MKDLASSISFKLVKTFVALKLGAELWLKGCYSARAGTSTQLGKSVYKLFKTLVALPYPRQIRVSPHTHVHFLLCKFSST
jgi:hypothetical protein